MKIWHLSAVLSAVLLAVSGRYYLVTVENAALRTEANEFQQVVDSMQPQLLAQRQQLQAQQEKLNKASALSQNIGPAVISDIRLTAERSNSLKLKELLQKYGLGTNEPSALGSGATSGAASTSAKPAPVVPNSTKKGGN